MKVRHPRPRGGGGRDALEPCTALGPRMLPCEVGQHGGAAAVAESGACGVGRGKWPWWEEEGGGQASLCNVAGGEVAAVSVTGRPRVPFLSLLSTHARLVLAEVEGPAAV